MGWLGGWVAGWLGGWVAGWLGGLVHFTSAQGFLGYGGLPKVHFAPLVNDGENFSFLMAAAQFLDHQSIKMGVSEDGRLVDLLNGHLVGKMLMNIG